MSPHLYLLFIPEFAGGKSKGAGMRNAATYQTALKTVKTYQKILEGLSALDELIQKAKGVNPQVTSLVSSYIEDARRKSRQLSEAL